MRIAFTGLLLVILLAACNRLSPAPQNTLETAASLDIRVSTSTDDAEESAAGVVTVASTDLELVRDLDLQTVGLRFSGVTLPANAVINNAYIQFTVDAVTTEATSLTIQGQASDNAPTFIRTAGTNIKFDISSRARTAASVPWTPLSWLVRNVAGLEQRTPDLTPILQELISRPGWSSGNAVVFIVTGAGRRTAKAYDVSTTQAPLLRIEYTLPSTDYTLSVSKQGSGTVTGTSIDCGSTCSATLPQATPVTLTATPDSGFVFAGWSGDCSGTADCTLTMDANRNVTATFTPVALYTLDVTKAGAGAGTVTGTGIDCGGDCVEAYAANTPVSLVATPDGGSTFVGWSGACTGTGECTVTMDSNKTVTATFEPQTTLTVTNSGTGTGTVTGPGISCGSDCQEAYSPGTSVILTATAAGDSSFAGWSGACSGTSSCTLTMTANTSVTAAFNLIPPPTNEIVSISQTRHFLTGCVYASLCGTSERLPVPSTDPAGLVYHPPSNTLFIVDSEVEELGPPRQTQNVFVNINRNVWRVSLLGDSSSGSWNFKNLNNNHEPTGIAFCANDNHFYVSNDDAKRIYRYAFNGTTFTVSTSVATPSNADPEDIACDPTTGRIYVAGGKGINIYVYTFNGTSFTLLQTLDLFATAGNPAGVPSDPEGIAFDTVSKRIFLISGVDEAIFEFTETGAFVKKFDLSSYAPAPIAVQGLTIGPASGNAQAEAFYIADGGVDNNDDPNERDGIIYEARIQR